MCGIVGIVGKSPVNQAIFDGLTVLQHRGQDAAGMATYHDGRISLRKSSGLVRDVFHTRHMVNLIGNMGMGHVRYPTAGCSSTNEAQPFYVNSPYGICLAHNGNLTNAEVLKEDLYREDLRHINTDSDSEVLLNVFAHELQQIGKMRIGAEDIFAAVRAVHRRCRGGYAVIAMISGVGLVGFRDPHGIRPIVFGRRDTQEGTEWIIASESVAIDALGFQLVRDIQPGEAVFIAKYVSGEDRLCCWTGKVIESPTSPPVGGCSTRVLMDVDNVPDVCGIYSGPHPILYCGDRGDARRLKAFAKMYRLTFQGNV
jgi:amidophosphoribosyltransferase